jgi:hypothetical protein
MRMSPVMRGARATALATLVFFLGLSFSLGLSPSYARMGGAMGRPAFGGGHFSHFAPGGFNRRSEAGRFGFNRFALNRFDRFGADRFNRFGGNPLFGGGWGWDGWGGFPGSAASEPIIVGASAPVIINIGVDPGAGDAGAAYSRGCVVHKLNCDSNGKYVGERQIPLC